MLMGSRADLFFRSKWIQVPVWELASTNPALCTIRNWPTSKKDTHTKTMGLWTQQYTVRMSAWCCAELLPRSSRYVCCGLNKHNVCREIPRLRNQRVVEVQHIHLCVNSCFHKFISFKLDTCIRLQADKLLDWWAPVGPKTTATDGWKTCCLTINTYCLMSENAIWKNLAGHMWAPDHSLFPTVLGHEMMNASEP